MPIVNTPYVLNEIAQALKEHLESGATRTLYLSQLPMSEEDIHALREALGAGRITITSNQADRTIWRECAIAGVWWGEYYTGDRYSSPEKLTLQTIEIGAIPGLAPAQPDDMMEGLRTLEARVSAP